MTVEQVDREAAAGILWVKTTIDDEEAIAEAFARHRTASTAALEALVRELEGVRDAINRLGHLERRLCTLHTHIDTVENAPTTEHHHVGSFFPLLSR